MKGIKNVHWQLHALKSMWDFPEETLNRILWANTDPYDKEIAIGYASEYCDYMDAIIETDDPELAWESWCMHNRVEHEINNNPYTRDQEIRKQKIMGK